MNTGFGRDCGWGYNIRELMGLCCITQSRAGLCSSLFSDGRIDRYSVQLITVDTYLHNGVFELRHVDTCRRQPRTDLPLHASCVPAAGARLQPGKLLKNTGGKM